MKFAPSPFSGLESSISSSLNRTNFTFSRLIHLTSSILHSPGGIHLTFSWRNQSLCFQVKYTTLLTLRWNPSNFLLEMESIKLPPWDGIHQTSSLWSNPSKFLLALESIQLPPCGRIHSTSSLRWNPSHFLLEVESIFLPPCGGIHSSSSLRCNLFLSLLALESIPLPPWGGIHPTSSLHWNLFHFLLAGRIYPVTSRLNPSCFLKVEFILIPPGGIYPNSSRWNPSYVLLVESIPLPATWNPLYFLQMKSTPFFQGGIHLTIFRWNLTRGGLRNFPWGVQFKYLGGTI